MSAQCGRAEAEAADPQTLKFDTEEFKILTTTSSSRGKVVPKIGFAIKIRALKDSKISNFPVSAPTTPNNENSRPKLIGEQRRYSPLGDRSRPSYKHDHNTVQKKNMRTLWRPEWIFCMPRTKEMFFVGASTQTESNGRNLRARCRVAGAV